MRSVSIFNDTGLTFGTKIIDEETGANLSRCTEHMRLEFRPGDPVRAEVTLGMVKSDVKGAEATFWITHPETGILVEVRKVVLADGTTLEF
jgi:hypothetical protein